MDTKYRQGDVVYLLDDDHLIEEAVVVMTIAGFVTIRFTKRDGGTRVRAYHLDSTREEAENARNNL